jgi:hypothetical protein
LQLSDEVQAAAHALAPADGIVLFRARRRIERLEIMDPEPDGAPQRRISRNYRLRGNELSTERFLTFCLRPIAKCRQINII